MADFEIVVAGKNDLMQIERCVNAAYEKYIDRIGKPPGPMMENYAVVLREHAVFVIRSAGLIVAVLVLIDEQTHMLLDNVAVDPALQGQGLGKKLMLFAEKQARQHGFDTIELYTHEVMTENLPIYAALGYTETERKTVNGYHRIYMRKMLPDHMNLIESN